jgi:signal transduction histidine kinase/FixJ family two-component response regulator
MSPYQLTLDALTYSWRKQATFNIAVAASFALVGGPILAMGWVCALCTADWALQRSYRRLAVNAPYAESDRGLTWLSWHALAKGACWYAVPVSFTVLSHSYAGLAFVGVQAVGLTALAVSTARNARRVLLAMVMVPVIVLPCCVLATLGPKYGAAALCETLVLAIALWHIGSGTSAVVTNWNRANSDRLQAMAEMRQALARSETAEASLSTALACAEAASRMKSEFLATMSHEIRTPLNSVLGMAQAMDRGELSDPQRERLGMISTAGRSLLILLNDVLDLSKIEAGKVELEDGIIDVEILAAGAAAFLPLVQGKDVVFSVTVAPESQRFWRGDPERVRQVLHNLISNAVKFTDHGAVAVRIFERDCALVLSVEDTGIGIAAERSGDIFESFVQADASTTRRYGGSGLGLAICRELVTLMGGTIDMRSTEHLGSTFTVTLPLGPARHPEVIAEADTVGRLCFQGLRVLAAEDNPMNQVVLRTLLEAAEIQPVVVANGEEAVKAWKHGRWDIVLMDIQMPVMDGIAATRAIRAVELERGAGRTPIIALTANAMEHHRVEYLAAGIDSLVAKPINLTFLLETIGTVLGGAASQDSHRHSQSKTADKGSAAR